MGAEPANQPPRSPKRVKVKTTATAAEDDHVDLAQLNLNDEATEAADGIADATAAKPTIAVKPDSLSVFNKMFSRQDANTSSSVKWQQLVQALTDAGMTATQAPGSAVSFANDQGSIVFHEPHPEPVLYMVMLPRHIGKRLKKWFGWDSETSVLREKQA